MATTLDQLERSMQYIKAYCDTGTRSSRASDNSAPTGTITFYAGSSVPDGWLLCNGSTASRTTYADLYSAIGTTYGSGNGSTTFTLPDFRNKFPEGAGSNYSIGTSVSAGLPQITGYFDVRKFTTGSKASSHRALVSNDSGAISILESGGISTNNGSLGYERHNYSQILPRVTFSSSGSSSIYNSSSTVQPAALAVYYIIKT